MSTEDKLDESSGKSVSQGRGRPTKKVDKATPLGEHIAETAKAARERQKENVVTEKWYELRGTKLSLVKRVASGSIFRTFLGSSDDKKSGAQIRDFIKKLEKESRLKVRAL